MKNKNELLHRFQQKACCVYTQSKAHSIWNELKPFLTADEISEILIEWDHYRIGEGRRGLDITINGIIDK